MMLHSILKIWRKHFFNKKPYRSAGIYLYVEKIMRNFFKKSGKISNSKINFNNYKSKNNMEWYERSKIFSK